MLNETGSVQYFNKSVVFLVAAKPTTLAELNVLSFFLPPYGSKMSKLGSNVIWAINFKSEIRTDLRGCLEVKGGLKISFSFWSPIAGSSFLTMNQCLQNSSRMSPKILKNQILHFPPYQLQLY